MKKIRVRFVDSFNSYNERYIKLLKKHYELEFVDNPDFLFYGPYGKGWEHNLFSSCIKICMCSEGVFPDYNECDYGIGSFPFLIGNNRYFRVPYVAPTKELQKYEHADPFYDDRLFCNFVYSNPDRGEGALLRQEFCRELMKYKKVDCPGRVLNNMQITFANRSDANWRTSKIEFMKKYKFTICFENAVQEGMVSEKILDAFLARSIPIYWGAPDVDDLYNQEAFINCNEITNISEMVKRVIEIDQDKEKYKEMVSCNPVNREFNWDWEKDLEEYLQYIIESGTQLRRDPLHYDSGIKAASILSELDEKKWYKLYKKTKQIKERIIHKCEQRR